jgi:hypothetical protein
MERVANDSRYAVIKMIFLPIRDVSVVCIGIGQLNSQVAYDIWLSSY